MSLKKRSLIAGLLYISLAILGPIGLMVIPSQFTNASDLSLFASTHQGLLLVWFIVEIVIIGVEIVLTYYLWKIFNHFNEKLSLYAFVLRMTMVVIMVLNASVLLALFVKQGETATSMIALHTKGVYLWQAFFSVHILFIGYMVLKYVNSGWKYLGIAMILGALGYALDSVNHLAMIDSSFFVTVATILLVFVTIGEVGMAISLLLKKIVPIKAA